MNVGATVISKKVRVGSEAANEKMCVGAAAASGKVNWQWVGQCMRLQ